MYPSIVVEDMTTHDHRGNIEPPANLFDAIMARISEEERFLSVKKRLVLFSATILVSAGAAIPAANVLGREFAQSGFSHFLSLMFSDFGAVTANWQDFGLLLLESLPAASIAAFFAVALVFFWSLQHLARAMKVVFLSVAINS